MNNINNKYIEEKKKRGIIRLVRAFNSVLIAIFFLTIIVAVLNAYDFPDKGILWLVIIAALWGIAFSILLGVVENFKSASAYHNFIKSVTGKKTILNTGIIIGVVTVLISTSAFATAEAMTDYIDSLYIPYLFSDYEEDVDADADVVEASDEDNSIVTVAANGVEFNMVLVEKGTFKMGATSEQQSYADRDEYPEHEVTIENDFYIGQTEVTQELWSAVMGNNPSENVGTHKPVEMVNWQDCQVFISELNRITGAHFRMPTEEEWEFAARGGIYGDDYVYSGSSTADEVAWYGQNSGKITHDVAGRNPNSLGIYDMSGNVYEWCEDLYQPYCGTSIPGINKSGEERVRRGGGCRYEPKQCRVSFRGNSDYQARRKDVGLRLVMDK